MKVEVEIETTMTEGTKTRKSVPGTSAICGRCDHCVTVQGVDDEAPQRALRVLKQTCPNQEGNTYRQAAD